MILSRAASPPTHHPLEIPSPPLLLPSTTHRDNLPEVDMLLRKIARCTAPTGSIRTSESRVMTAMELVNERVTDLATTQRQETHELQVRCEDARDDRALLRTQVSLLTRKRRYFRSMASSYELEAADARWAWAHSKSRSHAIEFQIRAFHDSRTGSRRTERAARECTYSDFLKCQPLNFKGTKGGVSLTQWFEKMESVFHISNCTVACQIKYATCTLLRNAPTWWNSHVKSVGHDAAYEMPRKTLKKMMTDKYCPRGEIKKLEIEL
ncbi:hypothetical protein Tco_0034392 [Tanacetum coccineum]